MAETPNVNIVSHAFGEKANIDTAIEEGTVNAYDEVFFTDTNEMGWVDAEGQFQLHTPRTQEEITVMGNSNIGALKPGDKIAAGTSIDEFIKKLTQVQVPPTYTQPSVSLVNNGGTASGNYEAGTTIDPKVRATFNKGDAGDLTKISVLKAGEEVGDGGTTSPYDYTGDAFVIGDETVTFTAKVEYGEGEIKNDNLGSPYPTGHIAAGNKTSSAYSYNGRRYSFWGTSVSAVPGEITSDYVRALSGKAFNKTGTQEVIISPGEMSAIIAVPEGKTITKIRYDQQNDDSFLSSFTQKTVQVADARGGENGLKQYTVYYYQSAIPASADMKFIVTFA